MSKVQSGLRVGLLIAVVCFLYVVAWLHGQYSATGNLQWVRKVPEWLPGPSEPHDDHEHQDGHGHDHPAKTTESQTQEQHAHDEHSHLDSLELSDMERKNIGLTEEFLQPIQLSTYSKSISVPAIVVDRPGRTRLPVSAPMTGIVTHVHAVAGEAIEPGDLILEMRLTHEDLVTAQREYLQALGDLEIETKEIARLEQLSNSGTLSNKTLLERQYSRDKVQSLLRSQREALRLHGLSDKQIDTIESKRRLLTEMRILAPGPDDHEHEEQIPLSQSRRSWKLNRTMLVKNRHEGGTERNEEALGMHSVLVLQDLNVQKGQVVNAGQLLCTLADYEQLLLEGQAFENEAPLVARANHENHKAVAVFETGGKSIRLENLEFGWVDNEINPQSRTLKFFVQLPNLLRQDSRNSAGQRYVTWEYRTGQRMQLLVPIDEWKEKIVLPIEAVAKDGLSCYVFQQNGSHMDRVAVHEIYRDQTSVVLDNDGALYPGDVVALCGAHQMQLALKNKSGAGVDPHAGHSH